MSQPPLLARKRAAARAALWFEQLWPACWPALGLLGAYAAAALLDLPAVLPPLARLLLLAAVVLGSGALLWRGLRRVARPTPARADRRLEQETGLRHRPLAALADQPAAPSAEAAALWQVHRARLLLQIPRLRVGRPRPGLAGRDGWALRGGLLVALAAALVIAGPETLPRLRRALVPGLPPAAAAPGTQVQAWITPPAYTGLPPLLLQAATPKVGVPAGSRLTVSLTGGSGGEPALLLNDAREPFRALDAASWQAERELEAGLGETGRVTIQRGGATIASWVLTLIPDQPPVPAFTDAPGPASIGGRPTLQTRLAWQATDDYGVAGIHGELRLRERPGAPPLVAPAPLAGSPKSARGTIVQDLTAHPWAGLPVLGRIVARDGAGQTGSSAEAGFTLPERAFQNPVARALVAVRRQLSLTPDERRQARMTLDGLADAPEAFDHSVGIMLNLRSIAALLTRGRGAPVIDEAQARMWELALALEEGGPERTARALEEARQALRDAVDANRETPAERAEVERRMQELRDAIQRHIEALTEQAKRDGTEMPFDPQAPQMNARDLDRMAQRMQEAAREGRMDDARRQMAELERLLEQLQNARPERGENKDKQNAERRQRGRQQMDAVQDMVQREGGLLDRSQSRAAPSAAPPPAPQQRGADAKSQQAMRRALGELMQRFGDLTGQVPAPLGEADTAMREAGQALAEGRDAAAGGAQQRAIEALQKGGREMGQQLSRQFGSGAQPGEGEEGQEGQEGAEGQSGEGQGGTQNRDGQTTGPRPGEQQGSARRRSTRRDPLGRPLQQGTSGSDESGDVKVPEAMEQARTRQIQEELRRRGADRGRPQPELDYIDRLLKPF